MDKIQRLPPASIVKPLSPEETQRVRTLISGAWADATRRAYAWGWRVFERWCAERGSDPLPAAPEHIALFIADQADARASVSAIRTQLFAIRWAHEMAERLTPTSAPVVKMAWHAAVRKLGSAAKHPKSPTTMDILDQIIVAIDRTTTRGKRDAAILLVGFYGAFRRSELVAIEVDHVKKVKDGVTIYIPKSKTDQEGAGETIGIARHGGPMCAVEALDSWLEETKPEKLIFPLAPKTVANIVKRRIPKGLDPNDFGGHSLRAGFVTQAFRDGAGEIEIMGTTRHRNVMQLMKYRREADPIARGASRRVKPPKR